MDESPIRQVLAGLENDAREQEERTQVLQAQLRAEAEKLTKIRSAVKGLKVLLGEEEVTASSTAADDYFLDGSKVMLRNLQEAFRNYGVSTLASAGRGERDDAETSDDVASESRYVPYPTLTSTTTTTGIKRTRSTEQVAEVVRQSGEVITRSEVVDLYEGTFGFPETWANPRNSIGNALKRAVSKGLIHEYAGDRFGPIDFHYSSQPPLELTGPARPEET